MSVLKIIIAAIALTVGVKEWNRHQLNADGRPAAAVAVADTGFVPLPQPKIGSQGRVVVFAPDNCSREEGRKSDELVRELERQKIPHVRSSTASFEAADPAAFEKLATDHAGRGPEKLAIGKRSLYIDYVDGVGGSRLTNAFIERRLGCRGTARNVRSIARILAKMG